MYYVSLSEAGNTTVKPYKLMTHNFDGNKKIITYEYIPVVNINTQVPDTSAFYYIL